MDCGCVSEPNRVSNMTDEGRGFTPPVPVKVVEHIGPNGREMSDTVYKTVDTKIPNVVFGEPTVLLDTTTLDFSKDGDNDWYVSGEIPIERAKLSKFEMLYTITWDGVEYECFGVSETYINPSGNGTRTGIVIGNSSVIGYSKKYKTDAPFAVIYGWNFSAQSKTYVYTTSSDEHHIIKIVTTPFSREALPQIFYNYPDYYGGFPVRQVADTKGYTFNGGAVASGAASLAIGPGCQAKGDYSSAFGMASIANGTGCFAEGNLNVAGTSSTYAAHAEGSMTQATSHYAHSEGQLTVASGAIAHTEGNRTTASGRSSHAEGENTIANHRSQHVSGEFNIADTSDAAAGDPGTYLEIVGNGTADNARSNARTLDWSGNEVLSGSLTLGKGTEDEVTVTAAQLKALLATLTE